MLSTLRPSRSAHTDGASKMRDDDLAERLFGRDLDKALGGEFEGKPVKVATPQPLASAAASMVDGILAMTVSTAETIATRGSPRRSSPRDRSRPARCRASRLR
ncbi:hypothetical protein ATB98_18950 [Sinorhizobium saheli]|uniref:Uncharacterized protein n=1 Tax=Sinorhizobium saheli TaxID=36856 RepID=A0A178YBY6_SINSA|nr:hypothetical protein ATB98_18950 [Sinorhizobium saheli]